jgi:hypothetical protein
MESIARAGEVANVVVTAKMDSEWKIYALRDQGKGPIATRIAVVGEIIKESGMVLESIYFPFRIHLSSNNNFDYLSRSGI